jgi:hypothetical protein
MTLRGTATYIFTAIRIRVKECREDIAEKASIEIKASVVFMDCYQNNESWGCLTSGQRKGGAPNYTHL